MSVHCTRNVKRPLKKCNWGRRWGKEVVEISYLSSMQGCVFKAWKSLRKGSVVKDVVDVGVDAKSSFFLTLSCLLTLALVSLFHLPAQAFGMETNHHTQGVERARVGGRRHAGRLQEGSRVIQQWLKQTHHSMIPATQFTDRWWRSFGKIAYNYVVDSLAMFKLMSTGVVGVKDSGHMEFPQVLGCISRDN